ncbi:MAG: cation diffusion facilitator family transporter, partial [Desulfobacteria bacterium]
MHTESIERWVHDHTFGQDRKKSAEHRTLIVIAVTLVTMAVEIAAGIAFGSMALLADGLHMGSHASALAISAFAYYYTRRHAKDARFNFGTGKVSSLAGFAGAVVLVLFALVMAWESIA